MNQHYRCIPNTTLTTLHSSLKILCINPHQGARQQLLYDPIHSPSDPRRFPPHTGSHPPHNHRFSTYVVVTSTFPSPVPTLLKTPVRPRRGEAPY